MLWPSKYEKGITVCELCRLVSSVTFITFNFISGPLSFEIHFYAPWYLEVRFYFFLCLLYPLYISCSLSQIPFCFSFFADPLISYMPLLIKTLSTAKTVESVADDRNINIDQWRNYTDRETEVLKRNLPLSPPQIQNSLAGDPTQIAAGTAKQ